jgi:hypothetical protein
MGGQPEHARGYTGRSARAVPTAPEGGDAHSMRKSSPVSVRRGLLRIDVIAAAAATYRPGELSLSWLFTPDHTEIRSINVGASAPITVTQDTGSANLPVMLSVCQTNPVSGACINPETPAPSVTVQINVLDTPTFAVFVRAMGSIPFQPDVNRAFLRFKTGTGGTVGATSVAVQTQ